MKTQDFNWLKNDLSATNTIIEEAIPNRATLAETNLIFNENGEILLIDPHAAGTWETWMFPYSSLILPTDLLADEYPSAEFLRLKGSSVLDNVANALEQILVQYNEKYKIALKEGINQVIPELVDANGEIVSVDYSLKFSKTSNSYTAYRFEGKKIIANAQSLTVKVPHIWLSPSIIKNLQDEEKISGKAVAKNVKETIENMGL